MSNSTRRHERRYSHRDDTAEPPPGGCWAFPRKVIYPSHRQAKRWAKIKTERATNERPILRAYLCHVADHWHLTSQPLRKKEE